MSRKTRHAESAESMVLSFHDDIKKIARKNLAFRKAIYTGAFSELVVMIFHRWESWAKRHTTMSGRYSFTRTKSNTWPYSALSASRPVQAVVVSYLHLRADVRR